MDLHERWIPRAMLGGAALHLASGLADPRTRELVDAGLVDAGLVAALDGDPGREAILWFLALGLAFAALGEVARWSDLATQRPAVSRPASASGWSGSVP